MRDKIWFKKDKVRIKTPKHIQRNVFVLYSPHKIKIELATCIKIDTEATGILPTESKGFVTSKFRSDKINEINEKHRLWVEMLNKSFGNYIKIKKGQPLGFLDVEQENLKFQHIPTKNKTNNKEKKDCSSKKKNADWRIFG